MRTTISLVPGDGLDGMRKSTGEHLRAAAQQVRAVHGGEREGAVAGEAVPSRPTARCSAPAGGPVEPQLITATWSPAACGYFTKSFPRCRLPPMTQILCMP
ncbi:hypothetical protein ACFVT1_34525 [Streptomyces sp. NPDC057963]|uniref:hypothetical protein n=1 Tax=Streptomyces sp. NPDC057963 TaxID=3346290 RepID=UPI0036EC4389